MTIAIGDLVQASDVIAVQAQATSAAIAAAAASANAASALSIAGTAQATAQAAAAAAAVVLSVPALGLVGSVSSGNLVAIGQNGSTVAVTLGTFNAALTASVATVSAAAASAGSTATAATASAATALTNAAAALAAAEAAATAAAHAFSVQNLSVVSSAGAADTVPIAQSGSTVAVSVANLLGGETIDLLSGAGVASDTDTFMVGQGSNVLVAQTFAAIWTYLQGKLPNYRVPLHTEIASGPVTIDGTFNGQILVVTGAGVTLNPNYSLMTPGFECEIVTSGPASSVIWGAGITATNGATGIANGQYAKLIAFTSSAGNVVLACVGAASVSGVAAPGPITALTLGAITATSVAFSWTVPSSGTTTFYQVQYRVFGSGGAWTTLSPNPATAAATISGLLSSTQYDVQVAANNTGGVPSSYVDYSQSPTASTTAGAAPGVPSALATTAITSTTVALSWTLPSTGVAATYSVQSSLHGANSWTTLSPAPSITSATISFLTASAFYDFQVAGINSAGLTGPYDQLLNVNTPAPAAYAPNLPSSAAVGTITATTVALGWVASAVDGSHSAATSYLVAISSNGGSTYSTPINAGQVTTYTFTGLNPSTAYVFEVAASNTAGNSGYVTASGTTGASGTDVPAAVTGLTAGTVTSYTVQLTWTPSAVSGSHAAATFYEVQYRLNGSAIWQTATSSDASASYTVTGLIAGQEYQFNVFGTNAGGAGAGVTTTATPTASAISFAQWGNGGYPNAGGDNTTFNGTTSGDVCLVAFLTGATSTTTSCQLGFSLTQFDIPTSLQAATVYNTAVYGTLSSPGPATAGTYYCWMLFYDAGGDCMFAVVGATGQTVDAFGTLTTGAIVVT